MNQTHLNTLKEVAFGERWFVTDEVCSAASHVLKQFQDLNREVARLDEQLSSGRQGIKDATAQVQEARRLVQIATQERDQANEKLNSGQKAWKTRADQYEANFRAVQQEKDRLSETLNKVCKELAEFRHDYDTVKMQVDNLQTDSSRHQKEAEQAKQALSQAHSRIAQSDQRASIAERRLKTSLERNEVVEKNLARFVDGKKAIQSLVGELKTVADQLGD
jgi:chromosome segregation protein